MTLVLAIFGSIGGLMAALLSMMILDLSLFSVLFLWLGCGMTATLGLISVAMNAPQGPDL